MKIKLSVMLTLLLFLTFACTKEEEIITPKVISSSSATSITGTNAKFGGNIVWEEGFTLKDRGICFSTSPNPTIKNNCVYASPSIGNFNCILSGLKFNTTYYVRAFATYTVGQTGYGDEVTFTTTEFVSQSTLTYVYTSVNSVQCFDSIYSDGGLEITQRGLCYSTTTNPTYPESPYILNSSGGPGKFTTILQNLNQDTRYYVKPFLINANGVTYGSEVMFKTYKSGVPREDVSDIDGNVYHTIQLGSQVWMTENLRTTRFANGDLIPTNSGNITAEDLPIFQWIHKNNTANLIPYGRLYTWYAATDARSVAPEGWKVPSWNDWQELVNYLKAQGYGAGYAENGANIGKAVCTSNYWLTSNVENSPGFNKNMNNFSGLSLTPGGKFINNYGFIMMGGYGCYMNTTPKDEISVDAFMVQWDVTFSRNYNVGKSEGLSIRCLKN